MNVSDREIQILHTITYIWTSKKQSKIKPLTPDESHRKKEIRLMTTRGRDGWAGQGVEEGGQKYKLPVLR